MARSPGWKGRRSGPGCPAASLIYLSSEAGEAPNICWGDARVVTDAAAARSGTEFWVSPREGRAPTLPHASL
jgi:hypothetical protein